jgi:hypothetical protein
VIWSEQEGAIVYSLKDGSGAYFCLQNNSPDGVQITLDLRGSENVVMSRGTEETLDVVPPYKAMLLNTATGTRFFFRPLCFGTCVRMYTCTHVMYTCHVHTFFRMFVATCLPGVFALSLIISSDRSIFSFESGSLDLAVYSRYIEMLTFFLLIVFVGN